jgi:archaemetzincin
VEAINLWWIGEKDPGARTLDHVRLHLGRALGTTVRIWEDPARPPDAYDPRRKQWSTSKILAWMATAGPPGKVLAVTDQDLFIPILTFVFGEAQLGGRAAVVSTARLGEPGLPDPRVALERLAKEAVHELGHCYGLVHCDSPGCVMGRSSTARDVDRKRGEFCPRCRDRVAGRAGEAR